MGQRHLDWGPMIWMSYPGHKQSTVADRGMWGPEGGPPAPLLSLTSSTQHEGMGSDSLQTMKGSREWMARWCDHDNRKRNRRADESQLSVTFSGKRIHPSSGKPSPYRSDHGLCASDLSRQQSTLLSWLATAA